MNENYESLKAAMENLKYQIENDGFTDNDIYGTLTDIEDFTHAMRMDLKPTEQRFIDDQNETTIDRDDLEKLLKDSEKSLNAYEELANLTDELISGIQKELSPAGRAGMKPFLYVLKGDNHNDK